MRRILTTLAACCVAAPLLAQPPKPQWSEIRVKSATLGESRSLFVALPENYGPPNRLYPVLILLDADDRQQFSSAVANVSFLASRAAIPSMIVVGVANGKDRTHDLTPTAVGANATQFATAGGAGKFTDFLVDEVLPEIRKRYHTNPMTVLAGHSFGGLVALHAASTRSAFAGIIAMSPSLWWNDSSSAAGYADSLARIQRPIRLFATSGEYEPVIAHPAARFFARVDSVKPKDLSFAHKHYVDDNHGLTPLPSLIDGLRFIFQPMSLASAPIATLGPKADSAQVVNAYVTTRDSYAAGARLLAMPETLPEDQVNQLAYATLQFLKQPRTALWLFQRNVTNYPDSPNVFDSIGDAYLAMADTTQARAQFRHSLDVAKRTHSPVSAETTKKLADLDKKPKK